MSRNLQLEYYAIYCLAHFYPEFNDGIKSESPDFYSKSGTWGLEVTQALDETEEKNRNLVLAYYTVGKHIRNKPPLYVKSGLYSPCDNAMHIWTKKCNLLSRPHFQKFPSNRLAILSPIDHYTAEDIRQFSHFLAKEKQQTLCCFDVLYIISFKNVLKYDIQCETCDIIEFSRTLHYSIMAKAAKVASL